MFAMKGKMDCCGESHRGLIREKNEDQFLIADLKKSVVIHQTSLSYEEETGLRSDSTGSAGLQDATRTEGHAVALH